MPVNWYASLALIVVVGLLLVGYSRYERSHPASSSSGSPTTSQTWYAALGIDVCGTVEPNLPASTDTSKTGLTASGDGVLVVHPKNSSESGGNATLGKFVAEYKGLTLTDTTLRYPGKRLMSNGELCPKGTPDAGKPGYVIVDTWPSFSATKSSEVSGDPRTLKFANGQMITVAFLPATATLPKPPATAITGLINAVEGTTTTTTTAPGTSTTTAPTSTTSTTAAK
jgi:hypothetical protein